MRWPTIVEHGSDDDVDEDSSDFLENREYDSELAMRPSPGPHSTASSSTYVDPHSQSTEDICNGRRRHPSLAALEENYSYNSPDPHSTSTELAGNTDYIKRQRAERAERDARRRTQRPSDVSSLTSAIDELSTVASQAPQPIHPSMTTTDQQVETRSTTQRRRRTPFQQFAMLLVVHIVLGAIIGGGIWVSRSLPKNGTQSDDSVGEPMPTTAPTPAFWQQLGQDLNGEAAGDNFGWSVALSADGSIVAVGAAWNDGNGSNTGHVHIFQYNSGSSQWQQLGQDLDGEAASDGFGWSVALSANGSVVAVGAAWNDGNGSNSGHVRIFQYNSGSSQWQQLGQELGGGGCW